jgi:hypothetical protein
MRPTRSYSGEHLVQRVMHRGLHLRVKRAHRADQNFKWVALFLVGFQLLDGISGTIVGVLTVLVTADITHGSGRFNLAQGIIGTASGIDAALSTALFGLITANFDRMATFLTMASVALLGVKTNYSYLLPSY